MSILKAITRIDKSITSQELGKHLVGRLNSFVKRSSTMSFKEEKEKFLKMSRDEKRQHYKSQVTKLEEIMTLPEYFEKNGGGKITSDLGKKVSIWQGDITSLEIDAIVNAANSSLMGGGGVDGAIHSAAGPNLKKECATLKGCAVGEAKITGGYKLPAKYIIHTVGPQGEKPDKLKECYKNCLQVAQDNGLKSIAFPCISTGVYGYPQRSAADVAINTVKTFLQANSDKIDRVIFCLFLESDKDIYEELLQKYF